MPNEENPGQLEVLLDSMLSLLADGDTEEAKLISEEILNRSRSGPDRDHLIEARAVSYTHLTLPTIAVV